MQTYTYNDLVKELGIESLPPEAQEEIVAGVSKNIVTHIFIELLARLPQEAQTRFKLLVEGGKGLEAESLAKEHIPDLNQFLMTESRVALEEFKELQKST